jgi:molybdopterin converting factor small subunit
MTVTVRVFAQFAEMLGGDRFSVELPASATVSDVVAYLRESIPNGHLLPRGPLVAVNLEHVHGDRVLQDGDEVALLPPLAGG